MITTNFIKNTTAFEICNFLILACWTLSLGMIGPLDRFRLLVTLNNILTDDGWLVVFTLVTCFCGWAMTHPQDYLQRARAMLASLVLWVIVGASLGFLAPATIPSLAPYIGLSVGCFVLFLHHHMKARGDF